MDNASNPSPPATETVAPAASNNSPKGIGSCSTDQDQPVVAGGQEHLPASNVPAPAPAPNVAPVPAPAPMPARNYPCPEATCTKVFATQRALFGHLRTHPERQYRGAYPPPVFSRSEFTNLRMLLNPEVDDDSGEKQEEEPVAPEVVGGEVRVDQEAAAEAEGAAAKARLDFDLNVVPPPELPDLNLPPPNDN